MYYIRLSRSNEGGAPLPNVEMMEVRDAELSPERRPAVPYLKIPKSGDPYLEGYQCGHCGAVFLTDRLACASCTTRGEIKPIRLSNTGKLYNYTIVHRSFPGVAVPFVFAIVDLDDGGSIKGNLVGVEPRPDAIQFDMRVKVMFVDANVRDKQGNSYLAYVFTPA